MAHTMRSVERPVNSDTVRPHQNCSCSTECLFASILRKILWIAESCREYKTIHEIGCSWAFLIELPD